MATTGSANGESEIEEGGGEVRAGADSKEHNAKRGHQQISGGKQTSPHILQTGPGFPSSHRLQQQYTEYESISLRVLIPTKVATDVLQALLFYRPGRRDTWTHCTRLSNMRRNLITTAERFHWLE